MTWFEDISEELQTAIEVSIWIVLGASIYWTADQVVHLLNEHNHLGYRLAATERLVAEAHKRLAAVFSMRQQFVEASDEKDVVEWVLRMVIDFDHSTGASFVPLDEHGQPLPAIRIGDTLPEVPEAWVEYLASPAVRDRCEVCEKHNHFSATCPLLKGPFTEGLGLYCLPMRRGEHEFGVLNIYFSTNDPLDEDTKLFLQSVVDEAALALESVWLRKKELGALRQLQAVRQKADMNALFAGLLENVRQTLEADFGMLLIGPSNGAQMVKGQESPKMSLTCGEPPTQARAFIEKVLQGVLASRDPVILGNIDGDPEFPPGVKALLATPLLTLDQVSQGVLLVGNRRAHNFNQRQLTLLQTVAGQIALVVQNTRQLSELEYKVMIEERTRLAREIHDGLAQTLGFLKLQAAQMQSYLERGDLDRLKQSLPVYYNALAEAYQDARYAIDGLRISPADSCLSSWVEQTLSEFQESLGAQSLKVNLACLDVHTDMAPEVQAQLIRILQEALSNVRKHSEASQVWVSCAEKDGELVIEVRDNGCGFTPADIPVPSRHGLRGMRERAELIGAEFQIISPPKQGTLVRVSLPLKVGESVP